MGNLVETGLGWYLDEDYLLTVGSTVIGTTSSGGASTAAPIAVFDTPPTQEIMLQYGTKLRPDSNIYVAAYDPTMRPAAVCCYKDDDLRVTRVIVGSLSSQMVYYWGQLPGSIYSPTPVYDQDHNLYEYNAPNMVYTDTALMPYYNNYEECLSALETYLNSAGGSHTITKVQGGAGAFAFVSYPHDGNTVYVGVGISSIPNPNSAATVAVDGTNGSYNTFNREGMQFTMFYTEQLTGELTANVPVVSFDTDISGLPAVYEPRLFLAVANAAQIHTGYIPQDEDPYEAGGTSVPGGGEGTFDNTSDQIDDSTTPTFSFAGSGFCRIYNPNLSQLQNLANYLWTDTNFLQTIVNHAKQLLEDPIEAVISLAMLPVAIPQGTSETVKVLFISTGVSMPPATTQYVEVDCGTYTLEEYYGSALDYNPYTQVDLFLPFIGQVSLNTDEVMGHTIGVKYRVDIVSGLCVAKVFVDNDCMYQFSGNCAIFMPLNSADFSSYLSAAMTAATALVSAGAGVAAGSAATGAEAVAEPAVQTSGNLLGVGESLITPQMAAEYQTTDFMLGKASGGHSWGETSPASLGEMERKFISNTALAVLGAKISFEHASHLAGNSGILGVRRPYLIINRPDMCNPEKYGKYNGRPCMMYLYLGSLTGYTEIQEIQLTGFSATNPELAEISKMLKGGVIF